MRTGAQLDLEGPRNFWWPTISMDDQLWVYSIASYRYLETRRGRNLTHDEQALARLMRVGLLDTLDRDRPHISSTRSMRYSANLADRLWGMLETERTRVRVCYQYWRGRTLTVVIGRSSGVDFGATSRGHGEASSRHEGTPRYRD